MKKEGSIESILKEYLFLSKELLKFADAESLKVFEDLIKQREFLISKLADYELDKAYLKTPDGKSLIEAVINLDKDVYDRLLKSRNMFKNQFDVANVYEGFVGEYITTGNRFDSKIN